MMQHKIDAADPATLAYWWCKLNVYEWPDEFACQSPGNDKNLWRAWRLYIEQRTAGRGHDWCLKVWNALEFYKGPKFRRRDAKRLLALWQKNKAWEQGWNREPLETGG